MPEPLSTDPEKKAADASLKMAQIFRALQCAVTQCRDAIFFADETGLISRVNPAFEQLTGYSAVEVLGKDLSVFIAGGPHSDEYREIWGRVFQQRAFCGPVRLKTKSGRECATEMTLTPLSGARSQITSIVCSCRSLSEASPQAARASAANSGPSAEIARQLNNVLLTLTASADLTYRSLPPEHPLRSRLHDMKAGAHRASNLARLLLEYDGMENESAANSTGVIVATRSGSDKTGASAGVSALAQKLSAGPATLLVVADEPSVRESMVEFLSKSGYTVLAADSGEEALEKSKSSAIDLVITEVTLPRMSGQQLAGALAAFHPEIKVLFVSGNSQSTVLHRDAPGLNRSFLQRPFSLPALAEKVDGVLAPEIKPRVVAAAAG